MSIKTVESNQALNVGYCAGSRKRQQQGEALATMMASERILAQEWDTVEEDEAWQNL